MRDDDNSVETIDPATFPLVQTSSVHDIRKSNAFIVVDLEDRPIHMAVLCGDFEALEESERKAELSGNHYVRGGNQNKDSSGGWFRHFMGTVHGIARNLQAYYVLHGQFTLTSLHPTFKLLIEIYIYRY